ncbi:hypothetical protein DLJ49_01945 [Rhodovulum sp. 12E13]|uniref:COG4315 family predicted lipoprotein n=1 Tax=Rhodovulum sp. 12E13 TaxID=2203891 RepID=UPI000E17CBB3|nr:hypothetical protein [Rhodovulum sp. 12E13]RDC74768.1 hypothetical protein DLJ49_01945 [Rhodovulum sp. 12E13]
MPPRTATALPLAALVAAGLAAHVSAQEGRATLSVAETGDYLVGPEGKPVYLFTTDTQGNGEPPVLSCPVECREVWPPVEVEGDVRLGDDVNAEMAGTVEFDRRSVATYNGWPLYTFERDTAGEPPRGNHVESFGGEWYLIGPDGTRVEDMAG